MGYGGGLLKICEKIIENQTDCFYTFHIPLNKHYQIF